LYSSSSHILPFLLNVLTHKIVRSGSERCVTDSRINVLCEM
jgi:hypothetical protein